MKIKQANNQNNLNQSKDEWKKKTIKTKAKKINTLEKRQTVKESFI